VNPWEKGIWWLTIALTAAVLVKLWLAGLIKLYKLLFCYLACDFLASVGGLFIPFRSAAYSHYYFSVQTLKIVVAAFMLIEIYSLALERTPALARFGRNVVGYILLAAAAIPLVVLWANHSAVAHPYLRSFLLFEQTMDATMAIFLILISMFMAWFPVRMRRNVIVFIGGFILWALSRSAAVYIVNRWFSNPQIKHAFGIVQMGVDVACLTLWLFGLRREGEARTSVVGHLWNRAEAERLTEQLDAVNHELERLRRR
jgi:hypothetical protein